MRNLKQVIMPILEKLLAHTRFIEKFWKYYLENIDGIERAKAETDLKPFLTEVRSIDFLLIMRNYKFSQVLKIKSPLARIIRF